MTTDTHQLIKDYTTGIAAQVGIPLTAINLVDGNKVGCLDIHLMNLSSQGHLVSVLVYQADIDHLQAGKSCDRLEMKIQTALSRLNSMKVVSSP